MASQVEIANRALSKIGEARIMALSDDLESAKLIDSLWNSVRDAELRSRNWNFTIRRDSLPALLAAPAWGFLRQFQLPADCLRVLMVGEFYPGPSMSNYRNYPEAEWQIEGGRILTNYDAPLKVRYIARIEDTGAWDAAFSEVFACRLAVEICERLTQSAGKRQLAWDEYKIAMREAMRNDAVENPPEPIPDDSWMLSRL